MRVFNVDEVKQRSDEIVKLMRSSVFIYPTDTVYSIGCNAMIHKSVDRIRQIKDRFKLAFAVIVPSVDWVLEHCEVTEEGKAALEELPNANTLVFKLKDPSVVDPAVLNGSDSISIRIPDHWISHFVAELGYPFVTTSANHVGEPAMTSREDLERSIEHQVDFCIDEGVIESKPPRVLKFV